MSTYIKQVGILINREKALAKENTQLRAANAEIVTEICKLELQLRDERKNTDQLHYEVKRLLENFEKAQANLERAEIAEQRAERAECRAERAEETLNQIDL